MVSFEDGITATGFRKMAAFMERVNRRQVLLRRDNSYRSFWYSITRRTGTAVSFGPEQIDETRDRRRRT
jgi:hypothetical protein